MRTIHFLWLLVISLFGLTGCHGAVGDVIPKGGPAMEDVYDSMGVRKSTAHASLDTNKSGEADLKSIRDTKATESYSATHVNVSTSSNFHKLSNPELRLYIYPHFSGTDEIPIPGYYTVFNAYEKTHYALTSETTH